MYGLVLKYQMPLTDEHRYNKGIIDGICVIILDSGSSPLLRACKSKSDSNRFVFSLMVLLLGVPL